MDGDSSLNTLVPNTSPNRNLGGSTTDSVEAPQSTGGINAYITSSTDDSINDTGSMKIDASFGSGARETFMSAILFVALIFFIF